MELVFYVKRRKEDFDGVIKNAHPLGYIEFKPKNRCRYEQIIADVCVCVHVLCTLACIYYSSGVHVNDETSKL